jgi:hypothetical protein
MINNKINENNNNIENDEKEMLIKLNELYNSLDNKDRNIDEIINKIKKIVDYKNEDKIKYLNSLLNPEQYKDVKIPSTIPIPSCTYSFHTNFIAQPDDNGVFRYIINPNFLYKKRLSELNANNQYVTEDGTIIDSSFIGYAKGYYSIDYLSSGVQFNKLYDGVDKESFPGSLQSNSINLKQYIPDIYLKYRLVSASVIIKYIDKLEKSSGILGGTIVIDKLDQIFGHGTVKPAKDIHSYIGEIMDKNICKYYDIKLIRNTFYYKEVNCIDGLKLVYFPIDNTYEEFVDVIDIDDITSFNVYSAGEKWGVGNIPRFNFKLNNNYKGGFYFYFFTEGGTPSTKYKVDLYCNFECLPNLDKFNYLSYNINNMNITNNEKQEIINIIQNKPINKIKDFTNILDWKGILRKMKNHSINITSELNKKRDYNQINLEEEEEEEEEKEIEPKENKDKEIKIKKQNIVDIHNRMKERGKKKMEILNKKKNNPLYEFTEEEKKIIEDINKENIEDSNEIKKIEEEINNLNKIN